MLSRLAKILFSLLAVAAVFGLVNRAQDLIKQDPFSKFKQADTSNFGIQLEDVQVQHYNGSKLMGVAHVDTINVRQDRQYLDFIDIRNGVIHTPKGLINFTAKGGNYDALTHEINVTSGAHVTNPDMDLMTPAFLYDETSHNLTMGGSVTGKLAGGQMSCNNLVYHTTDGSYHHEKVTWVGTLTKADLGELAQGDPEQTLWRISGDSGLGGNNTHSFKNGVATDSKTLVKGDTIDFDQKTGVLTATGHVYYFSEKANLVCEKAVIYRKEKRAILTGNVHMLVKPKNEANIDYKAEVSDIAPYKPPVPKDVAAKRPAAPTSEADQQQKDLNDELRDSKTTRKYPVHVKADKIEYWYGKGSRHAVITGSPQSYQELPGDRWRRVATFSALYDGEKDLLTLNSHEGKKDARMLNSLGDDFIALSFKVSTKEDDDSYWADQPEGQFHSEDDELNNATNGGKSGGGSGVTPPTTNPPLPPPKTTGGGA